MQKQLNIDDLLAMTQNWQKVEKKHRRKRGGNRIQESEQSQNDLEKKEEKEEEEKEEEEEEREEVQVEAEKEEQSHGGGSFRRASVGGW